mmetsp:Transcript_55059/g.133274  ORF Transcript_55059/g.133274 Transcript_55059/m.133274 type:complete len:229 (+) Transcript_55059:2103-2789(+)
MASELKFGHEIDRRTHGNHAACSPVRVRDPGRGGSGQKLKREAARILPAGIVHLDNNVASPSVRRRPRHLPGDCVQQHPAGQRAAGELKAKAVARHTTVEALGKHLVVHVSHQEDRRVESVAEAQWGGAQHDLEVDPACPDNLVRLPAPEEAETRAAPCSVARPSRPAPLLRNHVGKELRVLLQPHHDECSPPHDTRNDASRLVQGQPGGQAAALCEKVPRLRLLFKL